VVKDIQITETDGCDGDNRPDGGEHLSLAITLRNESFTNASGVTARLYSQTGYTFVQPTPVSYGDLDARHYELGAQPFVVGISHDAPCSTVANLTLEITAAGGYTVSRTIPLLLETDETFQSLQFADDVEGTPPNGFTHYAESGADDWQVVTTASASPTHAWFSGDQPVVKNASLVSPPLYVSPTSVLSFRHQYILEEGGDGAVLEISTDDGATWTDIGATYNSQQEPAGAAFGSPFAPGRAFWSGSSGGFVQETLNLGAMQSALGDPLYAGQVVLVRWRIGCDNDNTTPPHEGWWIDDISLTDSGIFTTACDATAPCALVGVPEAPSVPVGSVLEQNRPNPLAGSTVMSYKVAAGGVRPVSLRVFNIAGQVVRTLVDKAQEGGDYKVTWDGSSDSGDAAPNGIYFYELRVGAERYVRKLTKIQ
jgi:hypothetical protein